MVSKNTFVCHLRESCFMFLPKRYNNVSYVVFNIQMLIAMILTTWFLWLPRSITVLALILSLGIWYGQRLLVGVTMIICCFFVCIMYLGGEHLGIWIPILDCLVYKESPIRWNCIAITKINAAGKISEVLKIVCFTWITEIIMYFIFNLLGKNEF